MSGLIALVVTIGFLYICGQCVMNVLLAIVNMINEASK